MTDEIALPMTDEKDVMPALKGHTEVVDNKTVTATSEEWTEQGPIYAIHQKGGVLNTYPTVVAFQKDNVYKEWLRIGKLPRKGCRHCWERGWEGRNPKTGIVIVCRCTYIKKS